MPWRTKGVHCHDLRYTGNTLAASSVANTREPMQRMGHSSVRAALIHQHLTGGRDQVIADHVDQLIKNERNDSEAPGALPPDKIDRSGA